jgi:hypothetical protein
VGPVSPVGPVAPEDEIIILFPDKPTLVFVPANSYINPD